MTGVFRSEEMALCQLFLHTESAYNCISELGELGMMQFKDTIPDKSAFQRKFVNEVRRCDEMERKLRYLESQIKKDEIPLLDTEENPSAPPPREMVDLEATLEKLENELKEVNANSEQLKKNFLELTELKHILQKMSVFFDEDVSDMFRQQQDDGFDNPAFSTPAITASFDQNRPIQMDSAQPKDNREQRIEFVAGVFLREKMPGFERLLWRACRGNVYMRQAEIEEPLEDPISGQQVNKCVFAIFFQGDQLKTRVTRICEGFHASLYPCPESATERRDMKLGVATRIEDLVTVLNQTQEHRHRVLVAAAKNLKVWFLKIRKIKAIYHTLNLFNVDVTAKCMIGEAWCAVSDMDAIRNALQTGAHRSNATVHPILNRMVTREAPPTFHRTNKFTAAFQAIVDAYGVARYREINPTPFTVITFPFLFAVMFGDCGHGVIMFLFALWMVLKERYFLAHRTDNEIWNTFFGGRYIILLMGLFSIYTGFIYNDAFSKSLNIFGSSWYPKGLVLDANGTGDVSTTADIQLNYTMFNNYTYPFGVDPVWQFSKNKISFTNSLKMKMSIILGVMHMMSGVFLSLLNHVYYKNYLNVFCEFIPQVIFMMSIFGYLIATIFAKWIIFSPDEAACAPSLLIMLINMFMFSAPAPGDPDKVCSTWTFYAGQGNVQFIMVVLAVICVPWMLLIKPLVLYCRNRNTLESTEAGENGERQETATPDVPQPASPVITHEEEPFDFGDVFVHQCIHTIEYCLGCISNTASYLRLWALSLAHAELSEVLWNMVLHMGLNNDTLVGAAMLSAVFAAWAVLTVAVLLLMEGLSAFLHALRLHWVEFQNKFYSGTGYAFVPFTFKHFTEMAEE